MIHRVAKSQAQPEQFSTQYLKKKIFVNYAYWTKGRAKYDARAFPNNNPYPGPSLQKQGLRWGFVCKRDTVEGLLGGAGSGVVRGDAAQGAEVSKGVRSRFSLACLFATQWTEARQAPLSVRLSRQEHGSGLPCPPPGDLSNPGMEPMSQVSCIGKWVLYPLGKTQHGCNFRQTLMKGSFNSDYQGNSEITPQSCSVLVRRAEVTQFRLGVGLPTW